MQMASLRISSVPLLSTFCRRRELSVLLQSGCLTRNRTTIFFAEAGKRCGIRWLLLFAFAVGSPGESNTLHCGANKSHSVPSKHEAHENEQKNQDSKDNLLCLISCNAVIHFICHTHMKWIALLCQKGKKKSFSNACSFCCTTRSCLGRHCIMSEKGTRSRKLPFCFLSAHLHALKY